MDSCRVTSLIKNSAPLGPYCRSLHMALWWPEERGQFLISKVPLKIDRWMDS